MKKNKDINNEVPIPKLQDLAKDAPVEIYPQLFNIVGIEHGSQKILLYTRAHYTKEEATEAFLIKAVGKTGIPADKWIIKVITSISAQDLEQEFIDIKEQVHAEKKRTKNALMKQILDDKDINLLHRHYDRFSNNEIAYMHEALTK